ncbi:hypothetical protein J2X54_000110 [Duganella sp. 3397]|uniref:hypothetical protein n=1 Tax=Duganella sp. 3397 TaxID=2817732 RepID=UPI00286410B3|nr:hypothetical protein [Duganella sp. 3397]MDR7047675.1 hypothetical protein [Duganella sp. 3397]
MGTYGAGLFHDDTASDVREDFLNRLREGHSAEEASKALLCAWSSSIDDTDDGPVFWVALAATQCEYGCLQSEVLHHALAVIDRDSDLGRWSGKLLEKRRGILAELRTKLLGPQPKARRPRKIKKAEPVPSHEVASPDGRGKAVAFSMPGAAFMQVYLEREVRESRGGGSVFVAYCAFDDVEMEWMSGPTLHISYPAGAVVQQQSSQHFYFGEIIPIVYRLKE